MGRIPLTRKEFYELADYCRRYALELARYDQGRVSLRHCHEFNAWLPRLQSYDRLARALSNLKPARPIARWQIVSLAAVIGLILLLALPSRLERSLSSGVLSGYLLTMILFYFVPERFYGTTIELLEAKVLRIVEALDQVLLQDEMDFTEAAYFRAKENLESARRELRQQIDLAHRRWG
jgi:hypothetical protein